jgi:hypothetical protein
MSTTIKCPNCSHEFALGEVEAEEYKKELQQKMSAFLKQKEEEYRRKTEEFDKQRQLIEEAARKKVIDETTIKIRTLEEDARQKTQQLQDFQKKELELLRERNELEQRTKNIDIEIEKRLLEDRKKIEQETAQREHQLFDLKLKEKDLQLEGLKKTIEELKRKSEQGSMQQQGEAGEAFLEEILKEYFHSDTIEEVGKGVEGADCILIVRNSKGEECGKIIFESKRTKNWSNTWVDKLKTDMRSQQADIAILVTQAFPRGMECFGLRDGVWISSFKEVLSLTIALRNAILHVADTKRSQENKGEKMQMLYEYLTGIEFRQQIEAIVEGFVAMRNSITKERIQMEKIWKEREKQLEKVLLSTSGLYGSIKGIAGASIQNIPLLESSENGDDMAH